MPKRKTKMIYKLTSYLMMIFIIYIGVVLLFENVAFLNRFEHYVIVSDSMEPTINVGDVVFINNQVDLDDVSIGDIVAFETTINNQEVVVVHYVYDIDTTEQTFTTIAENQEIPDDWTLTSDDLIGRYMNHLSRIGSFLLFAQSSIGRIIIIVDVILIYIAYRIFFKQPTQSTPKNNVQSKA